MAFLMLNLIFGTVWYSIRNRADDIGGVQSLVAAIFFTAAFSAMINMNVSVPALLQGRAVFYRETSSYYYDPSAQSIAAAAVELPWLALILLATQPVVYFMLYLDSDPGLVFTHFLIVYTLTVTYFFLGNTVASIAPTFEVAQALLGALGPLFFLFGGMWSPQPQMPWGSRWFSYIDPITYAFRAIIPGQFVNSNGCAGNCTIAVPDVTSPTGFDAVPRYAYVTEKYDLYYEDRFTNLGYLVCFTAAFFCTAALGTRYVRHIVR